MDPNSKLDLARCQDSIEARDSFAQIALAEGARAGLLDSARDVVAGRFALVEVGIEVAVVTELDPELAVWVPDGIRFAYLHRWTYFRVVERSRHLVDAEEGIVALLHIHLTPASSLFVCELDSRGEVGVEELWIRSWSGIGLGEGQHRRCWRRQPLARCSMHGHTDLVLVGQRVPENSLPFYFVVETGQCLAACSSCCC